MIVNNKGEIGKWKLTEEEELLLGKDCSVGCIHKMGCENEGATTICRKFIILCIEIWAIVDHVL